jgi:arabinofuranan 3-O-arabinosyltransferase
MTATLQREPDVAGTEASPAEQRSVERLRLGLVLLGLCLAVFGQSAGNAATDTKLDLVVSPMRFMAKALKLWDPLGNAGQLQNQAYGYLFPIGPFYAVMHGLGFQPWEAQRAFEAAIVCFAFLGTYLVARRLGVDSFWPAVAAGLAFALAPRVLGELTSISAELMPTAALPWVLLPLITAAERGSPRRAAARSGVALLFAGGVNAAATLAILPIPALWLLTRSRGPRRAALLRWWSLAVVLSCAWWAIPLVQLGRFSPPFIDWVESASATTLPTSLLATLRGLDHWEAYLGPGVWPGGWILAVAPAAILATTAVAAIGLAGISRSDVAHRVFLWCSLLLGLIVVTAGHPASIGPVAAGAVRNLLDGPLVPFRNVHKFDPLVRFPLAIGVGHTLLRARVPRFVPMALRRSSDSGVRISARALAAVAAVAVGVVAVTPVWTNHLVSSQRVSPEPSWWSATATWLSEHSGGARALVVPGSASPVFLWGGTVDDPIQAVATTPWTVRGAVPLSQAGYVRLLNSIEAIMAGGRADPTLAALLTRAGIGYVVLANDLDPIRSASTPLVYVRATLDTSPGLHLTAGFGQAVGGTLATNLLLDGGGTVARPAVQIYSVDGYQGMVSLMPTSSAVAATGSSDTLPGLVARGLSADQAVLYGPDANAVAPAGDITTDGIRKREASFAGLLTPSATMTQSQAYSQDRPVHDYLPTDPGPLSAYRYLGISDVGVSSSGADALAYLNRSDHNGPWSALDGDPTSAWQTTGFSAVGQWLQVDLDTAVALDKITVSFAQVDAGPAPLPTRVAITTDAGVRIDDVFPATIAQTIPVAAGPTKHLRITFAAFGDHNDEATSAGIAELVIPGVTAGRTLVVPSSPDPAMLAFDASTGYRSDCLTLSVGPVCEAAYAASGEEDSAIDRTVTLTAAQSYAASASVRFRGSTELDGLLDAGSPIQAHATSVYSPNPQIRPGAAVDGDPATFWEAAQGDEKPALTLTLPRPTRVQGLTISTPVDAPVAVPLTVTVVAGDVSWSGPLPADGHVLLPHVVRTTRIRIRVDVAAVRSSASSATGRIRLLPVGIGEVRVDGVAPATPSPTVTVPCGDGPALLVNGVASGLTISASRAAVLAGEPVSARRCAPGPVQLPAGSNRLQLAASSQVLPVSITLEHPGFGLGATPSAGTLQVTRWGATDRRVRVHTTAAALVVVHENANPGWQATLDGHRLTAVMVDGWEQAFVVPAAADGTVLITFAAQTGFSIGLGVGAVAVLALLWLAFGRRGKPDEAPALRDGRLPRTLLGAGFGGAVVLLAGPVGLLAVTVVAIGALLVGRGLRRAVPILVATPVLIGGIAVALSSNVGVFAQQNSGQVQLLCVTALGIGALGGLVARRDGENNDA